MGKLHRHAKLGDHYQAMAAGYRILRSPLADTYNAVARHYRENETSLDAPGDPSDRSAAVAAREPDPGARD
jgi:hypothetical protein